MEGGLVGNRPDPDAWAAELEARLAAAQAYYNADAARRALVLNPAALRKYIAHARHFCHPTLSAGAADLLAAYYVGLRAEARGAPGSAAHSLKVTPRALESLKRLAEARARLALCSEVTEDHAKEVVALFHACRKAAAGHDRAVSANGGGGAALGGSEMPVTWSGTTARAFAKETIAKLKRQGTTQMEEADLKKALADCFAGNKIDWDTLHRYLRDQGIVGQGVGRVLKFW